jgi:hypothetical protein
MAGLSERRLAPRIAELLWEMCFHFVGPDEVRMDKAGEAHVIDCLDALETLAEFNCSFGHGRKATDAIAETVGQFLDMAVWYKRPRIARGVLKCYQEGLQGCYEDGRLTFPYGYQRLRASLRRASNTLAEEASLGREREAMSKLLAWSPSRQGRRPTRA